MAVGHYTGVTARVLVRPPMLGVMGRVAAPVEEMGMPHGPVEFLQVEPAEWASSFELYLESHHGDGGLLLNQTLAHRTIGRSYLVPLLALDDEFKDLLAIRRDDAANVLLLVIDAHGRGSMLLAFARDDCVE